LFLEETVILDLICINFWSDVHCSLLSSPW